MTQVVRRFWLSSRMRFMTSTVEYVSRSPVGSSRRRSSGLFASARAMATRCCSPPESSLGRCSSRSPNPTVFNSIAALNLLSFALTSFSSSIGSSTFSTALNALIKLNVWNTNPIRFNRILASSA
mmetsp:Transcript_5535/g.13388  ORF Transcript_5535/g.13388 Transcript_5535/m.13388 type:complete len:125 (-) Transcript_5535:257-631(-)